MKVYSIQLSQWRKIKNISKNNETIKLVDITIKNNPNHFLSPTWFLVSNHKKGILSDLEYEKHYFDLLNKRKIERKQDFLNLIKNDDLIAFACFCNKDNFCHRKLALKWLENECKNNGIEFQYLGEI